MYRYRLYIYGWLTYDEYEVDVITRITYGTQRGRGVLFKDLFEDSLVMRIRRWNEIPYILGSIIPKMGVYPELIHIKDRIPLCD